MRHRCPAPSCEEQVPNTLFSCRRHWFMLSASVRGAIYATAGKSVLAEDRRGAIMAAREEWRVRA